MAFVGVVVVKTDGSTYAIDLDRKDLRLAVTVDTPPSERAEIGDLADHSRDLFGYDRVTVFVVGHKRAGADHLFQLRLIAPGEAPFAPSPLTAAAQ